jgi:hypothetical protein
MADAHPGEIGFGLTADGCAVRGRSDEDGWVQDKETHEGWQAADDGLGEGTVRVAIAAVRRGRSLVAQIGLDGEVVAFGGRATSG